MPTATELAQCSYKVQQEWDALVEFVEERLYDMDMQGATDTLDYQYGCDLLDRYYGGERTVGLFWDMEDMP